MQELAEDIGSESKGLSEKTIASLRESKYKASKKSRNPSNDKYVLMDLFSSLFFSCNGKFRNFFKYNNKKTKTPLF